MAAIRVVQIRFTDEHRSNEVRRMVCHVAKDVFPTIPGVTRIEAAWADHEWDVVLLVHFASMADVEPYRTHPTHVDFVEKQLKPRLDELVARNYET